MSRVSWGMHCQTRSPENTLNTRLWACLWLIPGGGGVLAFEMGVGVPPACSKPASVAIRLMAKKTPCPNFEINTQFN